MCEIFLFIMIVSTMVMVSVIVSTMVSDASIYTQKENLDVFYIQYCSDVQVGAHEFHICECEVTCDKKVTFGFCFCMW